MFTRMVRPHPSILVLDDEAAIREALALALTDRYVVHTAVCGAEAFAILRAHRVALIVLDVALQGESGLDLIAPFRRVSSARILVLTGQGSEAVAAQAVWAKADGYLAKPITLPTLRAAVDRLVGPAMLPADLAASIQRVLDREFAKPLQFADLAGQFGVSEAHLRRLFRTVHGKTPRRYVIETRLQHAATLLRTTAHRVEYIAAEVGYPSSTLFNRAFRAFFGSTPSEYRARVRE